MTHLLEQMRAWKTAPVRTYNARDVEEVNLLVDWQGQIKRLGRITIRSDASLYMWVYGKNGRYFYGLEDFPQDVESHTFDFSKNSTTSIPHLSVHVSGQTHIRDHTQRGGFLAGPVQLPHLGTFRGEHVATIVADDLQALPDFNEPVVSTAERRDLVIKKEGAVESGRLAIFANGDVPEFKSSKAPYLTIHNRRRGRGGIPIHYGIVPLAQEPLGQGPGNGVMMLAGWKPTGLDRLLYVRAQ